jgi:hypothetical protein
MGLDSFRNAAYQIPIKFQQRKPKIKVVAKLTSAMMAPFRHQVP